MPICLLLWLSKLVEGLVDLPEGGREAEGTFKKQSILALLHRLAIVSLFTSTSILHCRYAYLHLKARETQAKNNFPKLKASLICLDSVLPATFQFCHKVCQQVSWIPLCVTVISDFLKLDFYVVLLFNALLFLNEGIIVCNSILSWLFYSCRIRDQSQPLSYSSSSLSPTVPSCAYWSCLRISFYWRFIIPFFVFFYSTYEQVDL